MKKQLLIVILIPVLIIAGLLVFHMIYPSYKDKMSSMGYNYEAPDDWGWSDDGDGIVFWGPKIKGNWIYIGFTEKFLLEEGDTLNSEINNIIENLNVSFTNYTLITRNYREINGMNAQEFVYTYFDNSTKLKLKQIGIEKNGYIMGITYSSIASEYDKYEPLFEESLNSFKIN